MIPEDAVQAAAEAIEAHMGGPVKLGELARAALEAAYPHMLAGLLSDLTKLAKEFDRADGGTLAYTVSNGRFQMRKNAHDQLMYIVSDHYGSPK